MNQRDARRPFEAVEWRVCHLNIGARTLVPASELLAECSRQLQLPVRPLPHGDPLLCGALALLDIDAACIWFDRSLPLPRSHEILAHEFAHAVMHRAQPLEDAVDAYGKISTDLIISADAELSGYSTAERRERDADRWAADLLLPLAALETAYIRECTSPDDIAAAIEMDRSFVVRRLRELLHEGPKLDKPQDKCENRNDSALANLDVSQRAAATTGSEYALVSAGPGTGKTLTLAARYLFLVQEQNVAPDSIVILTFSRRAAGELTRRCVQQPHTTGEQPWIGTVHAYAYELLRRFGQEAGLRHGWQVISSDSAAKLMDVRMAARMNTGDAVPTHSVASLLRMVSQLKEQGLNEAEYSRLGAPPNRNGNASISPDSYEFTVEYLRFFNDYQHALTSANRLDFADLLIRAANLLNSCSNVKRLLGTSCAHLLIDEFQDLTPAALRFIEAVVKPAQPGCTKLPTTSLWAVGDRLQSIYRFQTGNSACAMQPFSATYEGAAMFQLTVNYRSSTLLTSMLNGVAAKITASEEVPQERWTSVQNDRRYAASSGYPPSLAAIAIAHDDDSQYDGIAREIWRLSHSGIALNEQAVLCRTNAECLEVAEQLARRGIEVSSYCSWLRSDAVKPLMQALEIAAFGTDLGKRKAPDGQRSNADPILTRVSPSMFLDQFVFEAGTELRALWQNNTDERGAGNQINAIAMLLREASRWEIEDEIQQHSPDYDGTNRLAAFARHMRSLKRSGAFEKNQNGCDDEMPGGIRVMTVHSAKGLEYDAVYLPNMLEGRFPRRGEGLETPLRPESEAAQPSTASVDEETCVFFVAISRARQYLLLSYSEQTCGRRAQPSPFVRLYQSASGAKRPLFLRWSADKNQRADHKITAASPAIALHELPSTEETEAYEACPKQFWYERQAEAEMAPIASSQFAAARRPNAASVLDAQIQLHQSDKIAAASRMQSPPGAFDLTSSRADHLTTKRSIIQRVKAALLPPSRTRTAATISPELARRQLVAQRIRAGEFPPLPDSLLRCAECPFCYVCPD